jgi:hypothetical protein
VKTILQAARSAGPYLLIEALLPGGTLIALLVWMMRKRERDRVTRGEGSLERVVEQPL